MKVADYIAHFLWENHMGVVFELPGGMTALLLDALHRHGKGRIVSMHHEQGAAFAADAFGRMTGLPGVALATSGPGAINLLTGVGNCYFDSVPALFLTGQVNRYEMRNGRQVRQLGFQETDIVSMAKPITKAAWQISEPADVPRTLAAGFALAQSGRPGPVLIDIPMDIQRAEIDASSTWSTAGGPGARSLEATAALEAACVKLFAAVKEAKRPLVLVGGGVRSGRAAEAFRAFADRLNVPVVCSLMGVDTLPFQSPLRVGLIGTYGNRWANIGIYESDFLLVLGSRLDIRQTGADTKAFKGDRTIYHVDCDPPEVNSRVQSCQLIEAELLPFLDTARDVLAHWELPSWTEWKTHLQHLAMRWPDTKECNFGNGINPNALMHELSLASHKAAAVVVDVGLHQMWAAQSWELAAHQRFLTSGGMGSMGYALPAAVGAATAVTPKPIVMVAGDGGVQCNIQELQTVARNRLPIKMVVVNNQSYGMIRQFQETYFDKRFQSSIWGYSAPDFSKVARAYGIESARVAQPGEVRSALSQLWARPTEPFLLEVLVETTANAYPKLAFGRGINEMEPLVKPVQLEST
jgi:acetolactate synthase I/II/III large subunit